MKTTISLTIPKKQRKQGMTLADVERFVQNARSRGIDSADRITASVGWKGQLTRVTVNEGGA